MSFLTDMFGKTKVDTPAPVASTVSGFSGGGLTGSAGNGTEYTVSPDAMRTAQVGGVSGAFGQLGDLTGGLRSTVTPGFNDLLQTRLQSINDSARKSVGDLRTNLQSRRVLGSSFGQDTLTRADAEFSRQRDQATSDSFLKSLEVNNQLLQQQYSAYAKQYQTGLDELNLEAGMASNLSSKASDIFAANARLTSQLTATAEQFNAKMSNDQATGFGNFVGRVLFPTPTKAA